jgi:hypothetical protein
MTAGNGLLRVWDGGGGFLVWSATWRFSREHWTMRLVEGSHLTVQHSTDQYRPKQWSAVWYASWLEDPACHQGSLGFWGQAAQAHVAVVGVCMAGGHAVLEKVRKYQGFRFIAATCSSMHR